VEENFLADYATLHVQPGCTWKELRMSYRRLVRRAHPDRLEPGSREKPEAEERLKDINRAYDNLEHYYRRHGHLPRPRVLGAADFVAASARRSTPPPRHVASAGAAPTAEADSPAVRQPRWWFTAAVRWTAIAVGLALAIELFSWVPPAEIAPSGEGPLSPTPAQPHGAMHTGSAAPSSPAAGSFFSHGSSLGEVHAIQGDPTLVQDNVWHYGKSRVYFADGRVTHWDHDPEDPLKASALGAPPKAPAPQRFSTGSTMDEVRAIQGPPLRESDSVWDYGLSRVYFRDGRVSGWQDSPYHPLKVRR
jgi:hypothetical protein